MDALVLHLARVLCLPFVQVHCIFCCTTPRLCSTEVRFRRSSFQSNFHLNSKLPQYNIMYRLQQHYITAVIPLTFPCIPAFDYAFISMLVFSIRRVPGGMGLFKRLSRAYLLASYAKRLRQSFLSFFNSLNRSILLEKFCAVLPSGILFYQSIYEQEPVRFMASSVLPNTFRPKSDTLHRQGWPHGANSSPRQIFTENSKYRLKHHENSLRCHGNPGVVMNFVMMSVVAH